MTYRIRTLPRAEADIEHIFRWIEDRSAQGAHRWLAAFEQASRRVVADPLGYAAAREDEFVECELREICCKTRRGRPYRALFVVVDDEVRILRVRGPGQPDLLPDELAEDQ